MRCKDIDIESPFFALCVSGSYKKTRLGAIDQVSQICILGKVGAIHSSSNVRSQSDRGVELSKTFQEIEWRHSPELGAHQRLRPDLRRFRSTPSLGLCVGDTLIANWDLSTVWLPRFLKTCKKSLARTSFQRKKARRTSHLSTGVFPPAPPLQGSVKEDLSRKGKVSLNPRTGPEVVEIRCSDMLIWLSEKSSNANRRNTKRLSGLRFVCKEVSMYAVDEQRLGYDMRYTREAEG